MKNKELELKIKKFFSPKEGEAIINLIGNKLPKDSYNSKYVIARRGLNKKLSKARELLQYPEIKKLLRIKKE